MSYWCGAEIKSCWCQCARPFNSSLETWAAIEALMCEKPPVMTVSNTICILHWWACDPIVTVRGVPGECVKSVSTPWMCKVCVCVRGSSSRQKARGCCLTLIWKGRQYGSLTCPGSTVCCTYLAQPSPVASLLFKLEQQIATGAGRGGRRDTGCFDNENPQRKERGAKTLMNTFTFTAFSSLSDQEIWD